LFFIYLGEGLERLGMQCTKASISDRKEGNPSLDYAEEVAWQQ